MWFAGTQNNFNESAIKLVKRYLFDHLYFFSLGMDIIFLITRTSFAMNKKKSRKCLKKSGIMTIQER